MKFDIKSVYSHFQVYGDFLQALPYGNGHINDTFVVLTDQAGKTVRYILQRINHHIFREPEKLMDNVFRICQETHRQLAESGVRDIHRRSLTTLLTEDSLPYFKDHAGNYWRLYFFIEDAVGYDIIENSQQAYQAAHAFGNFQKLLTDLPGKRLYETVPGFHDTPRRFRSFLNALERDEFDRKDSARSEIDFYLSYQDEIDTLVRLHQAGNMPERVTHNDTKLNNVLLDIKTDEAICVIDLDTAMPGFSPYDFGDLVRTSTSNAAEDERELDKVQFLPDMFTALVEGYLSAADFLLSVEKDHLVFGSKLMTYEVGLRFLTDYLTGDRYFKTRTEDHNLVRSRTQMKIVEEIERQTHKLEDIVQACWNRRLNHS